MIARWDNCRNKQVYRCSKLSAQCGYVNTLTVVFILLSVKSRASIHALNSCKYLFWGHQLSSKSVSYWCVHMVSVCLIEKQKHCQAPSAFFRHWDPNPFKFHYITVPHFIALLACGSHSVQRSRHFRIQNIIRAYRATLFAIVPSSRSLMTVE